MVDMEAVRRRAHTALTIRIDDHRQDVFLLERAERLARSALGVLELIGQSAEGVDPVTLEIAALFYETGWVEQITQDAAQRHEVLTRPMSDLQVELSAACADESLRALLSAKQRQAVCRIIRDVGRRRTRNLAAQVLAEASSLDQIGPLAMWPLLRKNYADGRGIMDVLQTWTRQCEYNYWHARIRESFRFEPVKRIAERRLQVMESFMAELQRQANEEDLTAEDPQSTHRAFPSIL